MCGEGAASPAARRCVEAYVRRGVGAEAAASLWRLEPLRRVARPTKAPRGARGGRVPPSAGPSTPARRGVDVRHVGDSVALPTTDVRRPPRREVGGAADGAEHVHRAPPDLVPRHHGVHGPAQEALHVRSARSVLELRVAVVAPEAGVRRWRGDGVAAGDAVDGPVGVLDEEYRQLIAGRISIGVGRH
eukprot:CAMPEP_0176239514 /NCGR_PEP_ID=MMETSP0121_2-20121125/28907_1 /TAXON_ID=160619 /ORGANISM="Kryptoperidinium foliaceum, Strain CCMP 1326" /LENGTH=187 /DNA_ID=CAMNT_0017578997 /DNA_START=124 /DNA_END=684 /DNA_ORIENTATION=-